MRVGFKIEISPSIGFGHYSRTRTLLNLLPKVHDGFFIIPEDQLDFVPSSNIPVIPWIPEKKNIPELDLIFFDQFYTDQNFLEKIRPTVQRIIGLDFFDYECEYIDKVINLFEQNPAQVHKFHGSVYSGLKYAIIDTMRFGSRNKMKPKVLNKVSKVLICIGGADLANLAEKVANFLISKKNINKIHFILGPLKKLSQELENIQLIDSRISLHRTPVDFLNIIQSCDLAFSSASTIFLELSYLGIPTIILPQNEREKKFSQYLSSLNLCLLAEPDFDTAYESAQSQVVRLNLQTKAIETFDGKGSERILQEAELL